MWFTIETKRDEDGEAAGRCRRFPPVLSLGERERQEWLDERDSGSGDPIRPDNSFIHWVQPFVLETDFCGEWTADTRKIPRPPDNEPEVNKMFHQWHLQGLSPVEICKIARSELSARFRAMTAKHVKEVISRIEKKIGKA
jgi:hypothetical protein